MSVDRRSVLKSAAATVATAILADEVRGQTPGGPYADPTEKFNPARQHELSQSDFTMELFYPLTARPVFVGTFDQVVDEDLKIQDGNASPRPGSLGIGAFGDGVAVGDCFHGVAREFYEIPDHWLKYERAAGSGAGAAGDPMDPATWKENWRRKQEMFGRMERFDCSDPSSRFFNWGGFPLRLYRVPIEEAMLQVLPGQKTRFYSYHGRVPGPMIRVRLGQPSLVRYVNHLETETSVHFHGGHSPSHSDGFPTFYVLQGKARDYFYPNVLPLYRVTEKTKMIKSLIPSLVVDRSQPTGFRTDDQRLARSEEVGRYLPDLGESQSTAWYHDHAMDATAYNVSKGLAGFMPHFGEIELRLIRDRVLPGLGERSCRDVEADGVETDPERVRQLESSEAPGCYRHGEEPFYNPYDWPLAIQDKVLDSHTNQIAYDQTAHDGYLGDKFLVNGVIRPVLNVKARKYRFRMLNGSNARIYRLRLMRFEDFLIAQRQGITHLQPGPPAKGTDDPAFGGDHAARYDLASLDVLRIGKDSWLWKYAFRIKSFVLAMANRADVIVDFGALARDVKVGQPQSFVLVNTMPQKDGRGPKQKLDDGGDPRVLSLPFDVDGRPRGAELNRPIGLMKFTVFHPDDPDGPTYVDDVDTDSGTIVPYNRSAAEAELPPTILNGHHREIEDEEVAVVREFIFKRGKGAWQINGRFYDPTIANATPCVDSAEEWVLRNGGGGWWHPIHIHLESHQLVGYEKDFFADQVIDDGPDPDVNPLRRRESILEALPTPERIGLHDTQVLGPNTVARIRIRTRTFAGPFVFHCHNLEHEDMRMMFNFEPVAPPQGEAEEGSCGPESPASPEHWDPNVVPTARSHGNEVTWSDAVGELPWEYPPVPQTPVTDAGVDQIPSRRLNGSSK